MACSFTPAKEDTDHACTH